MNFEELLHTFGNQPLVGPAAAFMSSITWAVGASLYAKLSAQYPPSAVNTSRALVAFSLMFITVLALGHLNEITTLPLKNWILLAVSIASSYALGDVFYLLSTRSLGIPGSMALASVYPLWSAMGAWFFQDETLRGIQIFGLGCVMGGVIAVILSKKSEVVTQPTSPNQKPHFLDSLSVGVTLGLLASIFWALNSTTTALGARDTNPAIANMVRMGCALVLCPIFGRIMFRDNFRILLPFRDFKRVLPVLIVESYFGAFFYTFGLTHSSLAVGAALTSLSPAVAVPVALIFGYEKFSLQRTLGVCAVVTGIACLVA